MNYGGRMMVDNISIIYNKAKFILDNTIEYRDCNIKYILEEPKTHDVYLFASDDMETAVEFTLKDGKIEYYNVPEWDYNFDCYLLEFFEEGYAIALMTDDLHQALWNRLYEIYPTDVECKEGAKYYADYCKGQLITKESLEMITGEKTHDIMPLFYGEKNKKKGDVER